LKRLFDAEGTNEQKDERTRRNTLLADAAESRMGTRPPPADSVILPEADKIKLELLPKLNTKNFQKQPRTEDEELALEILKKSRNSK
jgi:hypothetical protein